MLDMLDKVVPSFLASTGGADGVGLIVFVFKGPAGSSSRRCLFQTLTMAALLSGV
jgi:L-aminopeptidase/D-esterase-like protein